MIIEEIMKLRNEAVRKIAEKKNLYGLIQMK